MCLGDWKSHGSEYYECSRYKENPNIANESVHAQVRIFLFFDLEKVLKFQSRRFPGPRSSEEISSLLRALGEPLEVAPAGTADVGPAESAN